MPQPPRSRQQVSAVCVTYLPDLARLRRVLKSIMCQVDRLIVVDNSDVEDQRAAVARLAAAVDAEHLALPHNPGLATALNTGILAALSEPTCSHVLLLDQDSVAAPLMVETLLAAEQLVSVAHPQRIGAMGPDYVDPRANRATTYPRFLRFPPSRAVPAREPSVFPVDMLISSGSLFRRSVLHEIGLMDESLFIDHVDTDWCLRARAAGLGLFVVQDAHMEHRLGTRWVTLGPLRSLPAHPPERLYYLFRNSLLLYRRPYAKWQWIVSDLRRLAVMLTVNMVAAGHPGQVMRNALTGIASGLANRRGKRG